VATEGWAALNKLLAFCAIVVSAWTAPAHAECRRHPTDPNRVQCEIFFRGSTHPNAQVPIGATANVSGGLGTYGGALGCRGTEAFNTILNLVRQLQKDTFNTPFGAPPPASRRRLENYYAKLYNDKFCIEIPAGTSSMTVSDSDYGAVCITAPGITPVAANEHYAAAECLWVRVLELSFVWIE
jgi:hypothetical protein